MTDDAAPQLTITVLSAPDKDNPFAVIRKPSGLPSAPLSETDRFNAYTAAAELFPELDCVCGVKPVEHGLMHRLDTVTDGLLVIAATAQAYEALRAAQRGGRFIKTYRAACDINDPQQTAPGFPALPAAALERDRLCSGQAVTVRSRFRFYGNGRQAVRPVTESDGMAALKKAAPGIYTTSIQQTGAQEQNLMQVRCIIDAGFRHQVRCHLAWLGLPVHGDPVYNPAYTQGQQCCFTACAVEFPHPLTGETVTVSLDDTQKFI